MVKIVQNIADLRVKSEAVTSVDEAKGILSELEDALKPLNNGVGLAAVQIGKPKRIGVIKNPRSGFIHLINPELIEANDGFVFADEGCLSFPQQFRNTNRFHHIIIKNHRIEENKFEEETLSFYYSIDPTEPGNDGLVAIAVQHELDHFDARLIIDYNITNEPIIRIKAKVGRNEPCPCGSGMKYKKCCGKNK